MPANLLDSYKIAYFGLPKAASTSVKLVLYELVHGEPFQGFYDDVHPKFPIFPIKDEDFASAEGYWRFTVVRDPVKRILSAYGNRVIQHQDIRRNAALGKRKRVLFHLRHPTLRVFPSPNGFYEKLEQYQAVSYSIWHHTTAISTFIGHDLSRFDAIFQVENLADLEAELSRRTGRAIRLPREQTGGPKITLDMLSAKARKAVLAATEADYELLRDFYPRP